MTEFNKITVAPVEVKVLTLLATDTASLEERQREHAAIFTELAKLQTINDPEEFVHLFTSSSAFANTNLCTQITVKGERFMAAPTQYSNHTGVRFTTTFDLLKPTEDYDERVLVKLREKTVPAGWTAINEPLSFIIQKQFMPVESPEEEVVTFNLLVRTAGPADIEVIVSGETSGFMRHEVGRISNRVIGPDERRVEFLPNFEALKTVYVTDPYVAMAVRYLVAHTSTLEWVIEILGQVKKEA